MLFEYWVSRFEEDIAEINQDSGVMLDKAFEAAKKVGICASELDPYNPDKYKIAPTTE